MPDEEIEKLNQKLFGYKISEKEQNKDNEAHFTFIINERGTPPDLPPSINRGTFKVDKNNFDYEFELVQAIYRHFGEGHYTVLSNLNDRGMKKLWKGEIEEEFTENDDEDRDLPEKITYLAYDNFLGEYDWAEVKKRPVVEAWKRTDNPLRDDN